MKIRRRDGAVPAAPAAALLAAMLATACSSQGAAPVARVSKDLRPPDRAVSVQRPLDALVRAGAPGAIARLTGPHGSQALRSGLADRERRLPMPANARFRIGSVTKTFTATLILQLVADGRLTLDDPLDRRLPGLLPRLDQSKITVRMLLGHRSGVPEHVGVLLERARRDPGELRRAHTARELVALVADRPADFPPGSAWAYSNTNYILLGLIAEQVGGAGYADLLQRRILTPLRLRATLPPLDRTGLPEPHPLGYGAQPDGGLREATAFNATIAGSAGGIVSSTDDLSRFIDALLSGRLLPRRLLTAMIPDPGSPPASQGQGQGYGLGMMSVRLSCGISVYGHNGTVPGFGTLLLSTRDGGRRLALSINTEWSPGTESAAGKVADAHFCATARGGAVTPPATREPEEVSEKVGPPKGGRRLR